MTRAVRLPNGRRVSLGAYVRAWRAAKAGPHAVYCGGLGDEWGRDATGREVLAELREGMHARINAGIPATLRGTEGAAPARHTRPVTWPSSARAEMGERDAARDARAMRAGVRQRLESRAVRAKYGRHAHTGCCLRRHGICAEADC